jgi:protein-tyrosine phosphatase
LIDIHFHCLPGVDDGPHEWDESVALCRLAHDEGIETIVATPHVLRGLWKERSATELRALANELNDRLGGSPQILLGSEYYFGHDMAELLAAKESIIPMPGDRYVLVELAAHTVPMFLDSVFYRVQLAGWTPVIAHPERNVVLQNKPEMLDALISAGAKTQITAGSITGHFGEPAREAAIRCFERGAVHFVASDSHSTGKRPPHWREAFDAISHTFGAFTAEAVMIANPAAAISGQSLPFDPDVRTQDPEPGWLDRLRGFLRGR